jgi:predicted nucleotidyltransferase/HEPN domain-containing protein
MTTAVSDVEAEEAIRAIGAAVGKALAARCVLLFGSRARGDHKSHSDVDLAVILADSGTDSGPQQRIDLETRGATVAESVSGGLFRRVDVRVWTEPEYRQEKRSINHVAGRSWREGRLLYGSHETLPGEEVVAELPHVRELIGMALGQLSTLGGMRDEEIFREEDFGFHAERATELTLKAWIALTGNQYQLTHHLHQLFDQLDEAGIPDASQFRDLSSLTNYAVVYQYRRIESPVMDRGRVIEDVQGLVEHVASLAERAEAQ